QGRHRLPLQRLFVLPTQHPRRQPVKKPPTSSSRGTLPLVRCAIYTRKSTEEGLQQEFNSLDAQRESAEAYIASQQGEGWVCLPDRYDDGGFTGGNIYQRFHRQRSSSKKPTGFRPVGLRNASDTTPSRSTTHISAWFPFHTRARSGKYISGVKGSDTVTQHPDSTCILPSVVGSVR